jgi:hypothetical protein
MFGGMPDPDASALLGSDAELARLYAKIRTHGRGIRISGYDITKHCNLRCEGCFFFEGDLSTAYAEDKSDAEYDEFFAAEVARGINYPHFAGAEPALVQGRLRIAWKHWQRGLVYTNGTVRIDPEIGFMIHVSLWGKPETDDLLRGAPVFRKAVENYRDDPRAIVMMTVSPHNIDEIPIVARLCADAGLRLSFNHFSPSRQYLRKLSAGAETDAKSTFRLSNKDDNLVLRADHLRRAHDHIEAAIAAWPETVIYSHYYNDWINDPTPRFIIDPVSGMAVDCPILNLPYHRQHHVDFSYSDDECCIANIDCTGCRHYVSGYTKIMADRTGHMENLERFRGWVEVFDTWCRLHFPNWDGLN